LLLGAIAKHGYTQPTSIQRMALPAALCGRDLVGIAKTGSGKTAAFVLPMVVHIMDQRELSKGEGPIGCIAAPTRELAHQIMSETKKFSKPFNLAVCGVYGGMSKLDQIKMLKSGVEVRCRYETVTTRRSAAQW
jgi:ATP-dependent RNA helicase DDX42